MQWLIVVLFATIQGDVYIFTKPTFDTQQECIASINNKTDQQRYIKQLVEVYKKPMPIAKVNCLSKDVIEDIFNGKYGEKKQHT